MASYPNTKILASLIERDLLERPRSAPTPRCFACDREHTPSQPGDDASTRFCSDRCRTAYDNGLPAYDPFCASKSNPRWYSLPLGRHGFLIDCAGCGQRFDSPGWRCCSTKCERQLGERREIDRLKAEAGIEFESRLGPKRKCQTCLGDIPRWRNGRQVSKATRFCSPKCSRSARLASDSPAADLVTETGKKCP
jgi:hypothetical protein